MSRITDILTVASDITGVPVEKLMARRGPLSISRIRGACWLVAFEGGKTYSAIGKQVGRDHTTIVYGCAQAAMAAHSNETFAGFLENLRRQSSELTRRKAEKIRELVEEAGAPPPEPSRKPRIAFSREPIVRSLKPKNDFSATTGRDSSHREADAIARGSQALLAALRAAQSNIGKAA